MLLGVTFSAQNAMIIVAKCYGRHRSRMELGKVKHEYGSGPAEIPTAPADHKVLHSIRKKLGIRSPLQSDADLVALVEERLPVGTISALIEHGVLEKEIYSVIVPRRTLQHRRARKEDLSREESDRAVRLARLAALTEEIFADTNEAMLWLRSPKKRFRGRTPFELMATEAGSRLVEEVLYQIDEGMAA
jgi:putative toxin-antitoxin system antitoxin component (TIGR02293 family)